jgi:hypothetical protein
MTGQLLFMIFHHLIQFFQRKPVELDNICLFPECPVQPVASFGLCFCLDYYPRLMDPIATTEIGIGQKMGTAFEQYLDCPDAGYRFFLMRYFDHESLHVSSSPLSNMCIVESIRPNAPSSNTGAKKAIDFKPPSAFNSVRNKLLLPDPGR